MARNTSVVLGDHFEAFVGQQVESGRYGTVSDVLRAGLRLLEDHETSLAALREAIAQGEASGDPQPLAVDEFLREKRRSHSQ